MASGAGGKSNSIDGSAVARSKASPLDPSRGRSVSLAIHSVEPSCPRVRQITRLTFSPSRGISSSRMR